MIKKFLFLLLFACFSSISLNSNEIGDNQSIIVCDNGKEMLEWDLEFLSKAEHSVEILACFFGGDIAQRILSAVEQRLIQVPDLKVYILTSPILLLPNDLEKINALLAAFPGRFHLEYHTQIGKIFPDVVSIDNHVKMFVVDEKYFSAGGTNLQDNFCTDGTLCPPPRNGDKKDEMASILASAMRDQDVVGRGSLAKELRVLFYKLFAMWHDYNQKHNFEPDFEKFGEKSPYFPVTSTPKIARFDSSSRIKEIGREKVKMLVGGPHQKNNAVTEEYLNLINSAKQEILIANPYFFPLDSLYKALIAAVNRGVKVVLLTNGISDITPPSSQVFAWGNRISYAPLFYGKTFHFWEAWSAASLPVKETQIFEYHVADTLLHKKMMVVDGQYFLVGSYNFTLKSAYGDYELVLVFDSSELSSDAKQINQKDLSFSRPVSPKTARDWYFDPVIAYLGEIQKKISGFL